ncbi:glycosyltransferase family 20-domain-containing protein [Mrakia frigida]|uniref:glycosyltransferase family 20-domain-containing protein n=1 Tax=Mrakia frigida TaxID=29902 RepID=UPI003FCC0485
MIGSHRIIVASLFLPSGVEFDIPVPSSPALSEQCESISEEDHTVSLPPLVVVGDERSALRPGLGTRKHTGGGPGTTSSGNVTPLAGAFALRPTGLSIIDDLQNKNKSRAGTPVSTPKADLDSGTNPFFAPSLLPTGLAGRQQAPFPPPPVNHHSIPAHGERPLDDTISAEGAATAPKTTTTMAKGGGGGGGGQLGVRGLPSEMAHPPSRTTAKSSPAGSGNASPKSGTDGGAGGAPPRPVLRAGKSSIGSGPGGRLPSDLPLPSARQHYSTPSSSALPSMTTTSHTRPRPLIPTTNPGTPSRGSALLTGQQPSPTSATFPPASPSSQQQQPPLGPTRSTSRSSSSRRRSSSSHTTLPPFTNNNNNSNNQADAAHPFHLSRNPQGNIGLQNALEAVKGETEGMVWIGALGNRTDGVSGKVRTEIEERLWKEQRSKAVWLEDAVFEGHYDVFCKQILWPTFHYSTVRKDETTNWEDYVKVNEAFAEKIVETYQEGDVIFINDYHLLLVPAMVRAKLPKSIIGFFLHIAFPSSEIFRCLAMREELIQGMLGANLVGFQTYNFSRHFRQSVSRVLQHVEATPKGIHYNSSFVDVEVFGIGIDVETLEARRAEPEVEEWARSLRERYGDTKLIVARDKLDEVKGLKHKLLSFERFLQTYPEWQGKVVLIQVALSTTETNESQENVSDIVTRINSKFSSLTYQPVVFLHTEPPTFSQYLGLLTAADAFICTSLREGMNLTSHEYVICQDKKHRPMILSEFTGSYSYSSFRSCLPVNPWDYSQVSDAIHRALTMSDAEATDRWTELDNHVKDHTAQAWARKYLTHLERAHFNQRSRTPGEIPRLDATLIKPEFKQAKKRLLLLDLEGVLWTANPVEWHKEGFNVPQPIIELLKAITTDESTTVYLLSGRGISDLEGVSAAVPKLGIVAEHGCFIKPAGRDEKRDWVSSIGNLDMSWRGLCIEILAYFSERTPGSYIEDRGASIVWRFSDSYSAYRKEGDDAQETPDHAWAKRQAAEAQNHVSDVLCEKYKLQIYPGRDAFLVLPRQTTRSSAVASILSPHAPPPTSVVPSPLPSALTSDYDFIVALTSDERLIQALNSLRSSQGDQAKTKVHTITAGSRYSAAKWAAEVGNACSALKELVQG